MSTLPASGYIENAARTNGEMKTALEDVRDVIAELPGGSDTEVSALVIASGSITPTSGVHRVDTEGAAAADDLTVIAQTNHPAGRLLIIRPTDAARVVTVKHAAGGVGQVLLHGVADLVLDSPKKHLVVKRFGTSWEEVGRFYGDDKAAARTFLGATAVGAGVFTAATDVAGRVALGLSGGATAISALGLRPFAPENMVVNAGMRIAQTGAGPFSIGPGAAGWTVDNFAARVAGAGVLSITRDTDVPSVAQTGIAVPYSLLVEPSTADASLAAGDHAEILAPIDGYTIADVINQTVTIATWIKSNKTGTYCLSLRNGGVDRSRISTVTVTAGWTEVTATFQMHDASSGGWNLSDGVGLWLSVCLAAGSTFHTAAGAWASGNFLATSAQVNFLDSTANDLRIALPRLFLGDALPPARAGDNAAELRSCRRYLRKSFLLGVAPAQNAGIAGSVRAVAPGTNLSWSVHVPFDPPMRAVPTFTFYNPTAANNQWSAGGQAGLSSEESESGANMRPSSAPTIAEGSGTLIHYLADARPAIV